MRSSICSRTCVDRRKAAALTGVAIAWGGTALLVSPAARALSDPPGVAGALLGQALLWLIWIAVLAIVFFWEQESLASLWLRFRWQSVGWAVVLIALHRWVLFPASEWLRQAVGVAGYEAGMETAMRLPAWARLIAVIGAGIVEETLFRGYAVTRLARLTGSVWVGGTIATAVFSALHIPVWGAGLAFTAFFVGGLPMTAFFIWRKDLLAMMIAHVAIDALGLVVDPMFGEWWKGR